MVPEYYQILAFVPLGIMLSGVITGSIKYNALGSIQRLIFFLMGTAFVADMISFFLMKSEVSTYPIFHIYAPIEYSLLTYVFVHFYDNKKVSRLLKISIQMVWVLALLNIIFWQDIKTANTNVTTVLSLVLVLAAVLSFFRILSKTMYLRVEKSSFFWVLVGVIIFFSSSFLLFAYSNWLKPIDVSTAMNVWLLHLFFNTIHYLCFNIALWMDPE